MFVERRISAAFKDIPGGQILGPSLDYSHRLLDFSLWDEAQETIPGNVGPAEASIGDSPDPVHPFPKVTDFLRSEGLLPVLPQSDEPPRDVTKHSLDFPASRSERLQVLSRGQTGAVIALGYASLRGYGLLHPTVGELRVGRIAVQVPDPLGSESEDDAYYLGEIRVTEVETLVPVSVSRGQGRHEVEFDLGYGFCFGHNESKAIAMSILDQGLERPDPRYPTQDEEFVLLHVDSVEATGFISHLKLPHYVTFQSKLDSVRSTRKSGAGKVPR
jgi:alpha-D-ribose 1-methylphosphonate 5-triphosphate synthase subunit PhnI